MIKVEKRTIEICLEEFREELIELCKLIKKHNGSRIGIGVKDINEHFKLKMKISDFYVLSEQLKYNVRRGKFWCFDDMDLK
ncbi:hypothetical protein Danklef1_64 [Polaribacter phage Danklef_1]|uniref:Uncharacterized protein n=1 Tax=Polaribacter phage Danklef_1 TaxID=2745646 RepID=A0A8E5E9J8_9CAUD|nr:hypothetical protein M1M23_gp64 [Polaribacter phage Danklef_1]QQV90624.1 hypothetical protein Danklef2_64 [Polaribacter phage Danklef_2]QQV90701.1 hypothetical protein Danklef3_65 [Polaribacter phage Danklef_3]QQV90778.1 hypothetical protein Danklef4_65 [Polaribacter phage Danklef_4]QQV90856.1 hypothetical protein Danklef5_66 [Polaribacter phage Danklef_5]QQV90548.1 hypothetical protein Danklef1_64 [Polaribacter phage Danklef_1]